MSRPVATLALAISLAHPALAKAPLGAPEMTALAKKVAPQSWYPDGYYDVRIAAEAQQAEYPRALSDILIDWDDGLGKRYDVIDCNGEWVIPVEVDPVTARYGNVALEISRLRSELERLKYPVAAYLEPLNAYERASLDEATSAPDPMLEGDAAADAAMDADAASDSDDVNAPAVDAYGQLAAAIEANRKRLAPKLPMVVVEGGCGAGEGAPIIVNTAPPQGTVLLINAFAFKVCTRTKPDPWDRFACKWNEIETGKELPLNGRYVYQVRWPDGVVRKGNREILAGPDGDPPEIVTFRKSGS